MVQEKIKSKRFGIPIVKPSVNANDVSNDSTLSAPIVDDDDEHDVSEPIHQENIKRAKLERKVLTKIYTCLKLI